MAKPHTIAVAGKGGVGKTTTCGMLIDYLCKKKDGPVLVVDADANSNLNEVLGVEVETSLGAIREEMAQAELKGTIPSGMTKADYAEFKFSSAVIEEDDFDMLVGGTGDDHAAEDCGQQVQRQQDHVTLAEEVSEESNDMAHFVASFIQSIIAPICCVVNPFSKTSTSCQRCDFMIY